MGNELCAICGKDVDSESISRTNTVYGIHQICDECAPNHGVDTPETSTYDENNKEI